MTNDIIKNIDNSKVKQSKYKRQRLTILKYEKNLKPNITLGEIRKT